MVIPILVNALLMVHFIFNLEYAKGSEKFLKLMEKAFGLKG